MATVFSSEKHGCDESGNGTEEKPFKTIFQALKSVKLEPTPIVMVDGKDENCVSFILPSSYANFANKIK